jgi:cytochrome c
MHRTSTPAAVAAMIAAAMGAAAPQAARAADTLEKARVAAGEIIFRDRCRICHSPDVEHVSYGPTLVNVVGRPAGSVAGYEYSEALSSSGIVWTTEALRAWIANNDGLMPGTKMRHVGVTDQTEQDFILAYLDSISQD